MTVEELINSSQKNFMKHTKGIVPSTRLNNQREFSDLLKSNFTKNNLEEYLENLYDDYAKPIRPKSTSQKSRSIRTGNNRPLTTESNLRP